MARTLLAMLDAQLVETAVAAARPSLAGDGVDITSWRTNGTFSPPYAAVFLDGSAAQTLDSPTGGTEGPEIWGYVLSQWWRIGLLNNGAAVAIVSATQGFVVKANIIGIFEKLAIAATPSAGTCAAKLAPLQEWQTP